MSVTVPTVYNFNYRTSVVVIDNNIDDVKDMWIGDNNSGLEKCNIEYIKRSLKI